MMSTNNVQLILDALEADDQLWPDFIALCDCGGRRAGQPGEAAALEIAQAHLAAIAPRVSSERVPYVGWRLCDAGLTLQDGAALVCNPLLGSQSTPAHGVKAEVIDLGRGTPEDFQRRAPDIGGRFVLVRHEYPFSPHHIHRRRKYGWAMEHGAAGFIIANPQPNSGPVAGSSGRAGQTGIPAAGTDFESAEALRQASAQDEPVHLTIAGEDYQAETRALILDLPGRGGGCVALSAHLDGHDLAESAMDNASGLATLFALGRAFAPHVAQCARGLKMCVFSAEEWALAGSRQYLDNLKASERDAIALNVNLDTVGGDDHLTALTSEFPRLDEFATLAAADVSVSLDSYRPMMANSDHYNFARHGIPALRLVAGFDRPQCNIRHILTSGDTREKVALDELRGAARAAAGILWRALTASDEEIARLRAKETRGR
jgi:aminopeptidase YwaD